MKFERDPRDRYYRERVAGSTLASLIVHALLALLLVSIVASSSQEGATENIEGEFILPAEFARKPETFVLRVQGDSMVEAAILDGDLIVVDPQPDARNGEIVVAMVDGEATVKRFYRESGRIRLQPENPAMAPIYADDVTIVGRVEAVIRKL